MTNMSNDLMNLTPNNLRVGNYVNYENTTHVIDEIHKEKVIHHWINSGNDGYVTKYNQILMIPLSIKEIEHLGFEVDDKPNLYVDDKGYCIEIDHDDFWLCQYDHKTLIRIAIVDYIHELQNLYYQLTKRELKF